MEELLTMPVKEMARRIREGELSPVDAVEAHIRRIEEVNPKINAVVVPRFDEARKEAGEAAERLAKSRDNLPPLFGVPCTIKDTYAMKGYTWSGGVWARKDLKADFDATVVERMKAAGAIILGRTNVPEAAMFNETYNHVYGRTNNPYDLARGVGGSSGGEGAIVAAAGSPIGIGSDIGGSIRYPAAFNGVPGHKPTGGMVPGTGHFPEILGPLRPYCAYGPIGRTVADLAYTLPLIAGPDGKDGIVEKRELKPFDQVDLKKLRVFFFDYNGQAKTGADVRRAVAMAAGALTGQAAMVEHWVPEGIENSLQMWQAGMAQNPTPFLENLEGDEKIKLGREVVRFILRRSKITWPALGAALIEKPNKWLPGTGQKMLDLADDLRRRMSAKLGDDGVLICPVFPVPAPKHHHIWLDLIGIGYSGVINIMHFPATIVPIFRRADGLPVSIQVVAAKWNDHLTLAAAKRLEEIFGGWKPPERV
ncbi:MAG TPA: amidase [bacterium]|nr:amidase [bacterium]